LTTPMLGVTVSFAFCIQYAKETDEDVWGYETPPPDCLCRSFTTSG